MSLIQQTTLILVDAMCLVLGLSILFANKNCRTNIYFFLSSITIFLWITFGFLVYYQPFQQYALLFARINFACVALFCVFIYLLSRNFPNIEKRLDLKNKLFVLIGGVFALLSLLTPYIIDSLIFQQSNKIVWVEGLLVNYYYGYAIAVVVALIYKIIKSYYSANNNKDKGKIKILGWGIIFYALFNVIFNILFPSFFHNDNLYWLGDYSAIFFLGFTAYGIYRHQLFNIKIIATESAVIIISIALLIEVTFSSNLTEGVSVGTIWALASYGGWLLIKSVKVEIKQKEELEHLTKKLEEANSHLRELDQMKDDFLGMASHELNTPLAAIEGYLSMILDENMCGELNSKTTEYLNRIFKSSQRLSAIVKDLLNVSRIESGRIHLIYAEVQIEDLIKQAVSEIDPKVKEKKHTTCLELPAEPLPKSWMDATRITEVILNLLSNAVKYTDENGHIEIGAKFKDKDVLVWVKDSGRGIPEDKADRVFAKFTQVDVLKDEVKGTGLGMYISKKFVELHDGKIWFESKGEGKGTTFFFSLPIHKEKPYDPNEGSGPVLR